MNEDRHDEVRSRRLAQVERRLNEIGASARGAREFHTLARRVDKIADYLKAEMKKNNSKGD